MQYHFVSLFLVCFRVLVALSCVDNQTDGLSFDIPKNDWHCPLINTQDAARLLHPSFQLSLIIFF